ncbi:MAG: M1 family aminopeptidase [Owenweeksia sp.]|nr:M1 family aminopeptidase [Owenweeksia sp.]
MSIGLHEGFATYYQWLSEENIYGTDFLDWERHKAAQLVFEASKLDTVPLGNGQAGSNRFYQKGAWVLHMLNGKLGHEQFQKVMQHYLQKYAYGLVTTDSLNSAIHEVTGQDFTAFFQRWVHTAGEPVLEISSKLRGKDEIEWEIEIESLPFSDST